MNSSTTRPLAVETKAQLTSLDASVRSSAVVGQKNQKLSYDWLMPGRANV